MNVAHQRRLAERVTAEIAAPAVARVPLSEAIVRCSSPGLRAGRVGERSSACSVGPYGAAALVGAVTPVLPSQGRRAEPGRSRNRRSVG